MLNKNDLQLGDIIKCTTDGILYMWLNDGKWSRIDPEIDDTIINIKSRYRGEMTQEAMYD